MLSFRLDRAELRVTHTPFLTVEGAGNESG